MTAGGIKIAFGILLVALYAFVAETMISGALTTAGYAPNADAEWIVTVTSGGIIAFVAAQIGVVVAGSGGGLRGRLGNRLFGSATPNPRERFVRDATIGVLILDVFVLVVAGAFFVWLSVRPEDIAVPPDADPLKEAPDYIALQAKAIIGLILAGAGGIGVASLK